MTSVEFLLRLLDLHDFPAVAAEDLDGPHGAVIRAWQELGFVARNPGVHPAPSCPYCGEGVPYRLGEEYRCAACRSTVAPRHSLLWPLDREALLAAVATHLGLRGGVRMIDGCLWQLGTGGAAGGPAEYFYLRPGVLSEPGVRRLTAYRRTVVLFGPTSGSDGIGTGRRVPLLELFEVAGSLAAVDPASLTHPRGVVRFDAGSGTLWAGDARLGEVPPGSREFHFVACLAEHLDRYVAYADLQAEVRRRTGSTDSRDEATFCHNLKRRVKERYVPAIDRLLATTNKGDGYRLRGRMEP